MATTKTTTNASKPRSAAPKRKPAARATAAKPAAASATTSSTRPASPVAQVGQLAERAVCLARGARRELDRQGTRARRTLGSNVESLSGRVEAVVQNGVNVGIKLVNGAQDRISRAS